AKNGIFAAYSGNAPQVMRFMLPIALPAAKIPGVLKLLNSERVQTVVFNWIRSVEDFFSRFNRKQRSSI
ncbi:MAG TPA: hypothetical protein PLP18_07435, partial [Smithellaceae bacterium]|nr:hypothetical protein [Smithellaceae bacterium]